jgi:glycosyltransferase 2 family protein
MTRTAPALKLTIALGVLGVGIALAWVRVSGVTVFEVRLHPEYLLPLAAMTGFNVAMRFVRWHFLLRRVGVKIPARPSLFIYLASLAAIVTPAYVGEVVRSVFVRRRFGTPMGRTMPVLIAERGLDVLTLAAIGTLTAGNAIVLILMTGGAAALVGVLWVVVRVGRGMPIVGPTIAGLLAPRALMPAIGLSFVAWLPASWLVTLAAASVGASVPLGDGMQIFARATLLGGLSLMPAGIGTTGTAAILALEAIGLDLATAVSVASMLRVATTGLTLVAGLSCLVAALRHLRDKPSADSREHFDEIADVYDDQLRSHIRELLVTRKTELIHERLAESAVPMTTGLDLGCGQGLHSLALARRGYRVIGADPSFNSLRRARRAGVRVIAASGLQLPFSDHAFDFVFAIGVLHHVGDETARRRAFAEIHRVLKPGGRLLIHETNPRNPLFRFYMGYVFPIVRRIDEGTEEWLDPVREQAPGMVRLSTDYATFLPDFAPRALMPLLLRVERWLEQSRWRTYAAHYLSVFQVTPRSASASQNHSYQRVDRVVTTR